MAYDRFLLRSYLSSYEYLCAFLLSRCFSSHFGDILWLLIENITVTSSCFRISIIPNLLRFHFFFFCFQAQLRAFIPEMLKYSTGRGKPGWGKESCKPIWWPDDIPWANVRSDVRTEEQKQRVKCLPIIELYCSKNWNLLDDTVQLYPPNPVPPFCFFL